VARRAVNLHGCALPHFAPRSSYCGGTPAARSSYWGAPLLRRLRRTLPSRAPSIRFIAVKKGLTLFVAALLAGVLFTQGGCAVGAGASAGKGAGAVQPSEAPAPVPSVIAGVPFLPQEDDTCGPSSLAMVLGFLGQNVDTAEIIRETRTEGLKGTLITDLAGAARRRGFAAEIVDLDPPRLRERISAGVPVILLVDLGIWTWSRPHYLVAYGWTPEGVVAHSGGEQGKVIPFPTLDAQWAKMGRLTIIVSRHGGGHSSIWNVR